MLPQIQIAKPSPAETIGRLNQKFFGRRAETIFNSPLPPSRVFSKRFMRQMPDGTTQVSGLRQTVALKKSQQKADWCAPQKLGSEHNFVLA